MGGGESLEGRRGRIKVDAGGKVREISRTDLILSLSSKTYVLKTK